MPKNVSYGRSPEQSDRWAFFIEPTPGATNGIQGLEGQVPAPRFSHPGGFYADPINLTITASDSRDVIRYTLDGSEPAPSSPIYAEPLSIRNRTGETNGFALIPTNPSEHRDAFGALTMPTAARDLFGWRAPEGEVFRGPVVKARVFRAGHLSSQTTTVSCFVDPRAKNRFSLPVISVSLNPDDLFGHEAGIYVPGAQYQPVAWTFPWGTGNYFDRRNRPM
jgi:hypothetical protein